MPERVLLRGGHVLSMDPEIGDVSGGDVLLEDDRIAAVGPSLEVGDAEVIDASNCVVMPGFVDSHRHTWETVIRGIAPDVSLAGYFDIVLDQLAPAYRPQDVYAGNYLGSLEALDARRHDACSTGRTSTTRPSTPTRRSAGSKAANLRAVYCYGNPNTSLADWWYTVDARGARGHPPRPRPVLLERRRPAHARDGHRAGPAILHARGRPRTTGSSRATSARPISVHVGMGPYAGRFSMVKQLHDLGPARPGDDVHPLQLPLRRGVPADRRDRRQGSRSRRCVEMTMGHGTPPVGEGARRTACAPSLSIDVVTTVPGDMFTQMRFAHASARLLAHEAAFAAGNEEEPLLALDPRRARVRDDRGRRASAASRIAPARSLPGKQADVVMIRCDDTNTYPLIDPVSTVVLQADTRNVDTVFVAGRAVKRAGTLVDADLRGGPRPRRLLARVPPRPHDRAAELGAERGARALSRELPSRAPQPGLPAPGTYSLSNQVLTRAFSLPTLARTVQKTGFAFELRRAAGQNPGRASATSPDPAAQADRLAVQGRCSRGPESPKEGEA